jgi:hypothetical protein
MHFAAERDQDRFAGRDIAQDLVAHGLKRNAFRGDDPVSGPNSVSMPNTKGRMP